jgi:bifunctional non-homologous end joining protein LigD
MADQVTIKGITVGLSHTGKVFFPGDGITKGDLIEYYRDVAGRMLPYLRDRPLAMARHPDGIDGQRIFQKNVPGYFPGWIRRAEVKKQDGVLHHVIGDKPATLVYLANQACIELHVFLSRTGMLDQPDQVVFDLDPPDAVSFHLARRAALLLRDLLEDELGVTPYVKTTGGKGLHVHLALNRGGGFDEARGFARDAAHLLASRNPDWMTTEQRIQPRGDRLYLDVMRNAYAQTVVAPYTVRARPGAHVATPIHWQEVEDDGLTPDRFTLRTVRGILDGRDDPWAGMTRRRYSTTALRGRLAKLTAEKPAGK